jgi:hypothetical protein
MKVVCLMLTRYAEINGTGGVSMINGDLDNIEVAQVPFVLHTPLYLVLKVFLEQHESHKTYQCRLEINSPNGDAIAKIEEPYYVKPSVQGRHTKLTIIATLHGIVLPTTGKYNLRYFLDDKEIDSIPFYIDLPIGPQP